MLSLSWLEIWIGFFIMMGVISFLILTSSIRPSTKIVNDQDALQMVEEVMKNDSIDHYEVTSIISNPETNVTTVIITTGIIEIALEIDNHAGKILSKERLAR